MGKVGVMSIERELLKRVLNYVENKYLTVEELAA
jgi:hypothetical protein